MIDAGNEPDLPIRSPPVWQIETNRDDLLLRMSGDWLASRSGPRVLTEMGRAIEQTGHQVASRSVTGSACYSRAVPYGVP
jgi:hypothetical protein